MGQFTQLSDWLRIFRTRPDRPWGPISLLYNGYRVSFLGVKRPERGANHPPHLAHGVKERVDLYLYSHSGPSLPVTGRTLPLPLGKYRHIYRKRQRPVEFLPE